MNLGVVLVAGLQNDPNVAAVLDALEQRRATYLFWNQRDLLNDCAFRIQHGKVDGAILAGNELLNLTSIVGAFNRLSEIELTPEFQNATDNVARHAMFANWVFGQWLEIAPIRVINRGTANDPNSAKAFQAQQIRHYFPIPDTLVTNDVEQARAFWNEHGRVVYKSCSGERSIVTELDSNTLESRAEALKSCPVMFQQYIEGTDIRVHVVGEYTFATAVVSTATDYRYDSEASWVAINLSNDYKAACVALSSALGLELAGIDLRITPSGEIYCFEVNPSPAFSVYEDQTGLPIADTIAKSLMGY